MSLRAAAQQALEALEYAQSLDIPHFEEHVNALAALRTALAEPEQEPVAWVCYGFGGEGKHSIDFYQAEIDEIPVGTLLYTTPPAAQRKPLTDEEIDLLVVKHAPPIDPDFGDDDWIEFARAIERAHGIGGEA